MQKFRISSKEIRAELARRNFTDFARFTFPTLELTWFHAAYYDKLDQFARGLIKNLMVFIPPQHGKSEASTRMLPAYLLGKNPDRKIAIVSYSAPKARKFNREIQRKIDCPEYAQVFEETKLSGFNVTNISGNWMRNADECEIVGRRGGFKTVGVGGALTGEPVDVLIMDDLYKDAMSAWSPVSRANVSDWYDTVADTRLHNNSQQLIVFTRWHHEDIAGQLLKKQGADWQVVKFPAIKETAPNEFDPRQKGEALWPDRHSVEKLLKSRERNPHVFQSLYQQNPKPLEGLLYDNFKTYDQLPEGQHVKHSYCDSADTGEDYTCHIEWIEHNGLKYITGIIYSQDKNEITEPLIADSLIANGVNYARFESNNGGRAFARNIERITKQAGNMRTKVTWFHQSKNKQARIHSNASTVQNTVVFPDNWAVKWPDFYNHITNYLAIGKNKHDDCADALTGCVENIKSKIVAY